MSTVAGEPGRSDFRLSDEESVRRPRNLRTDPGRLESEGLVGERLPLVPSFVDVRASSSLGASLVSDELLGGGGRGVSGGESGGAGMEVPSVREKFMGVRVRGWYLPTVILGGRRLLRWCQWLDIWPRKG